MRLNQKLIIFLIFINIASANVFAVNNGTNTADRDNSGLIFVTINPENLAPIPGFPKSTSGVDGLVQFWELPLWVQVTYLLIAVIGALGILKLMPLVAGRLKHALENPRTREIFYYIISNPGLTIKQLSEKQQINRGTLKYHLSQLYSNNKITFIRRGKVSQLYHNTLLPMDKESIVASYLRRDDKSPDILFTVMDNPGITNKELSERFKLDKSTITDYLKKFLDDGIIEFRQDGKFKRCYLMKDALTIMIRYKP